MAVYHYARLHVWFVHMFNNVPFESNPVGLLIKHIVLILLSSSIWSHLLPGPDLRLWGPLGRIYFGLTHFFRGCGGGKSEAPFGGGPFWWGALGLCPVCPALNPALLPAPGLCKRSFARSAVSE